MFAAFIDMHRWLVVTVSGYC